MKLDKSGSLFRIFPKKVNWQNFEKACELISLLNTQDFIVRNQISLLFADVEVCWQNTELSRLWLQNFRAFDSCQSKHNWSRRRTLCLWWWALSSTSECFCGRWYLLPWINFEFSIFCCFEANTNGAEPLENGPSKDAHTKNAGKTAIRFNRKRKLLRSTSKDAPISQKNDGKVIQLNQCRWVKSPSSSRSPAKPVEAGCKGK